MCPEGAEETTATSDRPSSVPEAGLCPPLGWSCLYRSAMISLSSSCCASVSSSTLMPSSRPSDMNFLTSIELHLDYPRSRSQSRYLSEDTDERPDTCLMSDCSSSRSGLDGIWMSEETMGGGDRDRPASCFAGLSFISEDELQRLRLCARISLRCCLSCILRSRLIIVVPTPAPASLSLPEARAYRVFACCFRPLVDVRSLWLLCSRATLAPSILLISPAPVSSSRGSTLGRMLSPDL